MGFPETRPRRLRRTPALRRLVAETAVRPSQLVLPLFVAEDATEPREISSMPGVFQHTRDTLKKAANEAVEAGLGGVMLFGLPTDKDAVGSGALDPERHPQPRDHRRGRRGRATQLTVMSDLCLDEFTDHGHCGVLDPDGWVDNDRTLEIYGQMALAQAAAGVDLVAPSGMMDGQVGVIRRALDAEEHAGVGDPGLLREVRLRLLRPLPRGRELLAPGRPARPTSRTPPTVREGVREALLDVEEGADMVMVKPALSYLDVVAAVRAAVDVPVAAYNISGEYSMVEAAAAHGWIDRDAAVMEVLTSIRRAGADVILTYWALDAARMLRDA